MRTARPRGRHDRSPDHSRRARRVAVEAPMARPLGTSAQTIDHARLLLIDLDTNEGVTGRAYLFCYLQAAAAG